MAVDPGSQKCGVAIVDDQGVVLEKSIVPTEELVAQATDLTQKYKIEIIIVGDRTNHKVVRESLSPLGFPIQLIDENKSSLEGRYRYLKENTKGWIRLIPIGLRTPDRPFDDFVAVILAERYLKTYPPPK